MSYTYKNIRSPKGIDVCVAEGTGLGYLIEHPVQGEAPIYINTPQGIQTAPMDQDHYRILHVASLSPILDLLCFSEAYARMLLEAWAPLVDWNLSQETLSQQSDLWQKLTDAANQINQEESERQAKNQ